MRAVAVLVQQCHDVRINQQTLTAQAFKAIMDLLDVRELDIANVSHEVRDLASAVGDLLVDVVIHQDLVHYHGVSYRTRRVLLCTSWLYSPLRSTPGTFLWM